MSAYIRDKTRILSSKPENIKRRERYQKERKHSIQLTQNWQKKHPKRFKFTQKKLRERNKTKLDTLLGTKCFICGKNHKLIFHEIYGKPHTSNRLYIIIHYEDFVRLCCECHKAVHYLRRENRPIDKNKLLSLL